MAFKYLIFSFEGGSPTGTNDAKVAAEFAGQDEFLVVDAEKQTFAGGYEIHNERDWSPIKEQQDYQF